jgi:hypothetical protein
MPSPNGPTRKWPSAVVEWLGGAALCVSLFMLLFGAAVWAQDTIGLHDSIQDLNIAVLQNQMLTVDRRITAIEDRLFGILMTTVGAVIGSVVSSIFSIRTYRRGNNERR